MTPPLQVTSENHCGYLDQGTVLFGAGSVEQAADGGDAVRWDAGAFGVLANDGFVGGQVNAVNLVAGDVAVKPLDFVAQALDCCDGFLGHGANLFVGKIADSGNIAFDYEFGHECPVWQYIDASTGGVGVQMERGQIFVTR